MYRRRQARPKPIESVAFLTNHAIENPFVAGTYKKILELIAQPAISRAEIKYRTMVEKICYRTDTEDKSRVQLENGHMLMFDEVVVTSPLGWLKRHLEAFEPTLPLRLVKAINSIGYGTLEKVYVSFPKAFWLSGKEEGEHVEGFIQFLEPDYATDSNPERWNQEAIELASISPDNAHPTLLFYIFGEQSAHITSSVAKLPDSAKKVDYLSNYFKPYYSRMPGYVEGSPDCTPIFCLSTDWSHDELAGCGSYSNFQVGLDEGDEDIKIMREGLPERGLWLAGEHTAPFVGLGTATGAYWSGELVGKRITELYDMDAGES